MRVPSLVLCAFGRLRLALACRTAVVDYIRAPNEKCPTELRPGGVSGVGGVKIRLTVIHSRVRMYVGGCARA